MYRLDPQKRNKCEAQRLSGLPDPAPEGGLRYGALKPPPYEMYRLDPQKLNKCEAQLLSGLPDPAPEGGLRYIVSNRAINDRPYRVTFSSSLESVPAEKPQNIQTKTP